MRTTPESWHACVQAVKQIPSDETARFRIGAAASYNRRMAVVISGDEAIVRYSRGLVGTYYALAGASGIIAVLCLMVALGRAVETGPWANKLWPVVSWMAGALSFAMMAIQVYSMARTYGRTQVAVGPSGLRMQLPGADGDLLSIGQERRFQWSEIADITYEHNLRKKICRFTAGEYIFTLTQNNCPFPETVAQLMAEKKGVALKAPKVSP
jgi:hypothetical protein